MLWFALLCGLSAFSTIEVIKRLTGIRGIYQLRQTMNWLEGRARDRPGRGARIPIGLATRENLPAFFELLDAMGVRGIAERNRVFNLPTEQLSAQINAAADGALVAPDRYPAFMAALLGPKSDLLDAFKSQAANPPQRSSPEDEQASFLVAARARSAVDHLQIKLAERWRSYLQGASMWIAGAWGIALTNAAGSSLSGQPRYIAAGLLLGGPFAWIARDLTAVIERSRR